MTLEKEITHAKTLIMDFAAEYGYEYLDNDKKVFVISSDKKIEIDLKNKKYIDRDTGFKDSYTCITARLMIFFDKFVYN